MERLGAFVLTTRTWLGMTALAMALTSRQSFVSLWYKNLGWCYPSVLGALLGAFGYLIFSGLA